MDERSANPARTLGKTASRLLIRNIHDVKMIEAVLDAYLTFCRETLQVTPRPLVDTDLRSLEFELLSFCAYLVDMMAPKYTALLRARGVVVDPVERFVGGLLEDLDGYFDAMGTKDLRASVIVSTSPEIKFGEGNQLRVEDRYVEYVEASLRERGSELKLFGRNLGCSIDPLNYTLVEIFIMSQWQTLVETVRFVVEGVLGK